MKKEEKCTNGGITLIALVITIIVLLILAGITISLVLGDNGLLNRAEQGKNAHERGEANDINALDRATDYMNSFFTGAGGEELIHFKINGTPFSVPKDENWKIVDWMVDPGETGRGERFVNLTWALYAPGMSGLMYGSSLVNLSVNGEDMSYWFDEDNMDDRTIIEGDEYEIKTEGGELIPIVER